MSTMEQFGDAAQAAARRQAAKVPAGRIVCKLSEATAQAQSSLSTLQQYAANERGKGQVS